MAASLRFFEGRRFCFFRASDKRKDKDQHECQRKENGKHRIAAEDRRE